MLGGRDIERSTDEEALAAARASLRPGTTVELWNGRRRLGTVAFDEPAAAPALAHRKAIGAWPIRHSTLGCLPRASLFCSLMGAHPLLERPQPFYHPGRSRLLADDYVSRTIAAKRLFGAKPGTDRMRMIADAIWEPI